MVALNLERLEKEKKNSTAKSFAAQRDMIDYVQTTGYFRCKQCNGAGNWKVTDPFFIVGLFAGLLVGGKEGNSRYMAGEIALYDGSTPNITAE